MEITPSELSEIVENAVKKVFEEQTITCSCGLSEQARHEMPHFFGAIKDIGDDNYSAGVEKFRESVKFFDHVRTTSRKVSTAVIIAVILSVVGGIGFLIKTGFNAVLFMRGGQ